MKYEVGLVSFLDVMGFGELSLSSTADGVNEILNLAQGHLVGNGEGNSARIRSFAFSDSIIRIRIPLQNNNNLTDENLLLTQFVEEVNALAIVQLKLLYSGVLIRGAITKGEIACSETNVFGPALIRAYTLEQQLANFPRIIIDPDVISDYCLLPKFESSSVDPIVVRATLLSSVAVDYDGLNFIDYLRYDKQLDYYPEAYGYALYRHRGGIIKKAKELPSGLTRAHSKYLWLANYHNQVVRKLHDDWLTQAGYSRNELLITAREVPHLVRIPLHPYFVDPEIDAPEDEAS